MSNRLSYESNAKLYIQFISYKWVYVQYCGSNDSLYAWCEYVFVVCHKLNSLQWMSFGFLLAFWEKQHSNAKGKKSITLCLIVYIQWAHCHPHSSTAWGELRFGISSFGIYWDVFHHTHIKRSILWLSWERQKGSSRWFIFIYCPR